VQLESAVVGFVLRGNLHLRTECNLTYAASETVTSGFSMIWFEGGLSKAAYPGFRKPANETHQNVLARPCSRDS
jgi:hypothetical protein